MWASLYLPKGRLKYERLDYWAADLAAMMHGLTLEQFNGYVEILSTQQHGLFIFYHGLVANCFYEGEEELNLSREKILEYFVRKQHPKVETIMNVVELDPRIIEAVSALETRRPLYRELEVNFLDMDKMFETLKAKRFTGLLRFYHIRSHPRLGNILLKLNKISREQLQNAVRLQLAQKGAPLRLGDALVQMGAIEAKDIDNALNLQSHARKGSDIEVAIAVFYQGQFLGGYSHTHKRFERNRAEILPQLVGTEVLLDIIEGEIPRTMELEAFLNAADIPAAKAPSELAEESSPDSERLTGKELSGIAVTAADLILPQTIQVKPEPSGKGFFGTVKPKKEHPLLGRPAAADTQSGFTSPAAEPGGQPGATAAAPIPEVTAPPAKESMTKTEKPDAETAPSARLLEHLQFAVEKFMGPLGKRLLGQEMRALGINTPAINPEQLRSLSDRLVAASTLIIGRSQAQKMQQVVVERLGLI